MDDVGYLHPSTLPLDDDGLRDWAGSFERRRYGGWRNHNNLWRSTLGLDTTVGKRILDYGCGYGIEALQFARYGNQMVLADLTAEGVQAAARVLSAFGYEAETLVLDGESELPAADIFYSCGVIHHIREPDVVWAAAARACPEARVLLYSDRAWARHGGNEFWRAMDEVGGYADYYTPDRLAALPDWELADYCYITPEGHYLTATLTRRGDG